MATSRQDRDAALAGLVSVIVAGDTYRLAAAAHFGLGVADTHALSYLDTHGPMPQSDLARYMGVTSGGATGVVDRLERAGIARREPDPHDRRKYRVELTERAHAIIDESLGRLVHALDDVDPPILAVLAHVLPELADGLTREADHLRNRSEA